VSAHAAGSMPSPPIPALIDAWCQQVGPDAVLEARLQLAELIEVVEDRTHLVTSTFLNHRTPNDAARRELLEFLTAFDAGLAAADPMRIPRLKEL
jgi:hypothetical protein